MPDVTGKVKAAGPRMSRLEKARADGTEPDFPESGYATYLLGYLWEVGPTMIGAMGASALSHSELVAWQSNSGVDLNPWEARTLVHLSRSYLAESSAATKVDCPPPHGDLVVKTILRSKRVDSNLDAFLG